MCPTLAVIKRETGSCARMFVTSPTCWAGLYAALITYQAAVALGAG
jgi:hypothetical protein